MKVWVSKYALTRGVVELDAKDYSARDGTRYAAGDGYFLRIGSDAHMTPEEAKEAAEKMRKRKIASVLKQLERLEAITF